MTPEAAEFTFEAFAPTITLGGITVIPPAAEFTFMAADPEVTLAPLPGEVGDVTTTGSAIGTVTTESLGSSRIVTTEG